MLNRLLLFLAFALSAEGAPLTPQPLINSKGLSNMTMAETGPRLWVQNFGGGSPGGEFLCYCDWQGNHYTAPTSASLSGTTISQTYPWGTCTVTFTVLADKTLEISGQIHNTSTSDLPNIDLNLCKIAFPTSKVEYTSPIDCLLTPGYYSLDTSSPEIACWFAYSDAHAWPGQIVYGQSNWGNNALSARGFTLKAGQSVDYAFRCNFCTLESDLGPIKNAANEAFAISYPQTHKTTDLRSLGQIFLVTGTGASGWAADHAKWAKNPRGWLGDPTLDISDKATFKSRMEAFCRQCVTNADSIPEMRGFVIWDIEGEQYPHGSSVYAGHPSKTPLMAPEMDEIANDLITILEDGGKYQVGFCLRQQQFFENPGNPEMAFYLSNWANSDSPEATADLVNEINYCRTRWGERADIFYVDSNSGNEINCYTKLAAEYPDLLIFPESFYVVTRMYAYEPQYQTGRPQEHVRNGTATQGQYTAVYPHAQSVINLADVANSAPNVEAVAAGMVRGDVEMVRIWWTGGPEIPLIQSATAKALDQGWPGTPPVPTPSPSPTPTPGPSPQANYSDWLNQLSDWIGHHPAVPNK